MSTNNSSGPLAFLTDLGLEGIEHTLAMCIEDPILDAHNAVEERRKAAAAAFNEAAGNVRRHNSSQGETPEHAAMREAEAGLLACQSERADAELVGFAQRLRDMRAAMGEGTLELALESESMPLCSTCGRRTPMDFSSELTEALSAMFGGECAGCLTDRLRLDVSTAIVPVPVTHGPRVFALGGSSRHVSSAIEADRMALNSRHKAIVISESRDTERRAREAESAASQAGGIRALQLEIREARYRVRMFGEAVRRFLAHNDRVTENARKAADRAKAAAKQAGLRAKSAELVSEATAALAVATKQGGAE